MKTRRIDLDAGSNMEKFLIRVGTCEYAIAKSNVTFTERQERFITDMRWQLTHRLDNAEVNSIWNPTVSQWNYLGDLFQKAQGSRG